MNGVQPTAPMHHLASPLQTTGGVTPADNLVQRLMSAIGPVLINHQQATNTRMDRLENSIQTLSAQLSASRKEAQEQTQQVAKHLGLAHIKQQGAMRDLAVRFEKLEKAIGESYDRDSGKSILTRLDEVSFAMGDLLERAQDSDAISWCPPESLLSHI